MSCGSAYAGTSLHRAAPVFFPLVFALLTAPAGADPVGWSTPRLLAPDSGAHVDQGPHAMAARDTSLWTVWCEERDSRQYTLKASRFSNGTWSNPEPIISDVDFVYLEATVDADQAPWVVWEVSYYPDSVFSLWSRRQGDSWTTPAPITTDTSKRGRDPYVTADPERGVWAVWYRHEPDEMISVLSSYCAADSWTPPALVTRFDPWFVPYTPVITAPPHGRVRSVWTGAPSGGIGLYSSTWNGASWDDPEPVPSGELGYWPSVCSDSAGGTWVTWLDGWSSETTYIRYAHHDGTGWTETGLLGTGTMHYRGMLCCDDQGWVWAIWYAGRPTRDSADLCVRHFDGDSWSDPGVVTTSAHMLDLPRVTATQGKTWVTWTQWEPGNLWLLYYSYTLGPGVAETPPVAVTPKPLPTFLRNVLVLPSAFSVPTSDFVLFDPSGRKAMALSPGPNDISHLSPGVYFVRSPIASRYSQPATKVVIQR